jgi:hypothetical protein
MTDFLERAQYYQKEILGTLALMGAALGGAYYYHYSSTQREKKAHIALSETLHEFDKASRNQATWQDVSLAAQTGYRQHKNSSLAPYFLSLQAEADIHKGDIEETNKIMDTVLREMPTSSPLYYPLKLKYARMLIGSKDQNLSSNGLKELEKLAHDSAAYNTVQDAALYYLGGYYAAHDEVNRAKDTWQILVQRFTAKKEGEKSPWAELAQVKLQ